MKDWKHLTDEQKAQLYIDYEFFENWMLLKKHVDFLVSKLLWTPDCDATCDPAGSNKHFQKYFLAENSCLEADLSGYNVYCNFPFKIGFKFVAKFERTKKEYPNFRALIVMPYRTAEEWVKAMIARNMWRLIQYQPQGSYLFTKPGTKNPFELSERCKPIPSIEPILALVFNDDLYEDWKTYNLGVELERH